MTYVRGDASRRSIAVCQRRNEADSGGAEAAVDGLRRTVARPFSFLQRQTAAAEVGASAVQAGAAAAWQSFVATEPDVVSARSVVAVTAAFSDVETERRPPRKSKKMREMSSKDTGPGGARAGEEEHFRWAHGGRFVPSCDSAVLQVTSQAAGQVSPHATPACTAANISNTSILP